MFTPGLNKLILKFFRMRKFIAIAEKILNNKEGLFYLIPKHKVMMNKWITMEKMKGPYVIKCTMPNERVAGKDRHWHLFRHITGPHLPLL